jgi:hypothetical protein
MTMMIDEGFIAQSKARRDHPPGFFFPVQILAGDRMPGRGKFTRVDFSEAPSVCRRYPSSWARISLL